MLTNLWTGPDCRYDTRGSLLAVPWLNICKLLFVDHKNLLHWHRSTSSEVETISGITSNSYFKIVWLLCSKLHILMTALTVSDCIALQTYSKTASSIGVSPPSAPLNVLFLFCDAGVVAFPFVWFLKAGFKVLWMLGRIASLAKPSNFQEGVPFVHFLLNLADPN